MLNTILGEDIVPEPFPRDSDRESIFAWLTAITPPPWTPAYEEQTAKRDDISKIDLSIFSPFRVHIYSVRSGERNAINIVHFRFIKLFGLIIGFIDGLINLFVHFHDNL